MNTKLIVLPYIKFNKDFKFAKFKIWRSTQNNWKKHLEVDGEFFFQRFKDHNNKPITDFTIITSNDDPPQLMWERLIHTLFFIFRQKLTSFYQQIYSDNFYYELWYGDIRNIKNEGYVKSDKFSTTLVASDVNNIIYPSQYVDRLNILKLGNYSKNEEYLYLRNNFIKNYNSYIYRSLSFYFKTKYKDLSMFSHFDDSLNISSALQIITQTNFRNEIGKKIGIKIVEILGLKTRTKTETQNWFEEFYSKVRSEYTHRGNVESIDISYNNMLQNQIATIIYELILLNIVKSKIFYIYTNEYFIHKELNLAQSDFDSLVDILSKYSAKDKFFNCPESEFQKYIEFIYSIDRYNDSRTLIYDNKQKLFRSIKTILFITVDLTNQFLRSSYMKKKYDVSQLERINLITSKYSNTNYQIKKCIREVDFYSYSTIHQQSNNTRKKIKIRKILELDAFLRVSDFIRDLYIRKKIN